MKIVLDGEFTTLNQHDNANRTSRNVGAALKKRETERVYWQIKEQCTPEVSGYPLDITVFWYRKNKRTDPDNIEFAIKYILDGLQKSGVIRNDGWGEVNSICHLFKVDKDNPRVEIFLESLT